MAATSSGSALVIVILNALDSNVQEVLEFNSKKITPS